MKKINEVIVNKKKSNNSSVKCWEERKKERKIKEWKKKNFQKDRKKGKIKLLNRRGIS